MCYEFLVNVVLVARFRPKLLVPFVFGAAEDYSYRINGGAGAR